MQFPKYLKDILTAIGFDNEFVISSLNEETIVKLEKEIEHLKTLDDTLLEHTKYDHITEAFKFDLGDRIFILNLPKYLKKVDKVSNLMTDGLIDEDKTKSELLNRIASYITKKKSIYLQNRRYRELLYN